MPDESERIELEKKKMKKFIGKEVFDKADEEVNRYGPFPKSVDKSEENMGNGYVSESEQDQSQIIKKGDIRPEFLDGVINL